MRVSEIRTALRGWGERESQRPDVSRGVRATCAVIVPLVLWSQGSLPLALPFVAFAAQSIAIVDVRGPYTLRFGLLLAMTAILAGAASLGELTAGSPWLAIAAAGLIAAGGGVWRHLMPDYGASLAIASTLLFVISANFPANAGPAHGLSALFGGLWSVLLQVAYWPVKPQHPLRRAVSDSWAAVADLFAALAPADSSARTQRIRELEAALRVTLDHTYADLTRGARATPLRARLEELNLAAARLATRVVALNTALESVREHPASASLSDALQPALTGLTNLSRTAAVAVVSRQPAHFASFEVRVRRLQNLLRSLQTQAPAAGGDPHAVAQFREILRQIELQLPALHEALRATVERAGERAAFSLELFDLDTWTLRPLAASLNLNRRIDPALVRFTGRVAVLTMIGVAVFEFWDLPHGYWLPLTMVIVLQPDYGSTRQRAAERVLGTLAGSIAASAFLWLQLPFAALVVACAVAIFGFGFTLKRHYATAVFFITLVVVLLTEVHEPVTWWFNVERLGSTLAGGALALGAAMFFWPVWERDRLPPILAGAVEANRDFVRLLAARFASGGAYDAAAVAVKRRAETANSAVFSSLQRMNGDPHNRREGLELAAALANGNQRMTRAFIVLALHLQPGAPPASPAVAAVFQLIVDALTALAGRIRSPGSIVDPGSSYETLQRLPFTDSPAADLPPHEHWVRGQLARVATELRAMLLAASQAEAGANGTVASAKPAPG